VFGRLYFSLPLVALLLSVSAQPQESGTLTLLKDSPLRVIRGVSVLQGAEGMRLKQGDILETGPAGTAQAQMELSGGVIVELGPSSQVFLYSQSGTSTELVLLTGWLKGETTAGSYKYSSPFAAATTKGGNVLMHVTANDTEIFVERGAASVSIGSSGAIGSSADKIFFTRRAGKPIATAGRPSQDFITAMPASFRDALPSRLSHFASAKPPVPKIDKSVSYADIERWLTSSWGKGMVQRFKPRLQDSAFHHAIESHLAVLPGWEPVLHP
jgi:hypothetical protein